MPAPPDRLSPRAVGVFSAAFGGMLGVLLCLALAACSGGRMLAPAPSPAVGPTATTATTDMAAPSGPITITYWETDTDDADVLLDELAAEFMKANPAVTVKRVHYSYDDLRNEFRARAFNGRPPELVRCRVSSQGRSANWRSSARSTRSSARTTWSSTWPARWPGRRRREDCGASPTTTAIT